MAKQKNKDNPAAPPAQGGADQGAVQVTQDQDPANLLQDDQPVADAAAEVLAEASSATTIEAVSISMLDQLRNASRAALAAKDHAAHAVIDDLCHQMYVLKTRAQDAGGKLPSDLRDLAKRIAEL